MWHAFARLQILIRDRVHRLLSEKLRECERQFEKSQVGQRVAEDQITGMEAQLQAAHSRSRALEVLLFTMKARSLYACWVHQGLPSALCFCLTARAVSQNRSDSMRRRHKHVRSRWN